VVVRTCFDFTALFNVAQERFLLLQAVHEV